MSGYLFAPPKVHSVPVKGETEEYPINRIFCVGRNYAAHAAELGGAVDRDAPWYSTKSPTAHAASGMTAPHPPGPAACH